MFTMTNLEKTSAAKKKKKKVSPKNLENLFEEQSNRI